MIKGDGHCNVSCHHGPVRSDWDCLLRLWSRGSGMLTVCPSNGIRAQDIKCA